MITMKKKHNDDDGIQIADMSATYNNSYSGWTSIRNRKIKKAQQQTVESGHGEIQEPPLTKKETRSLIINALGAGLLIASIFIIGAALFILFCIYVWFR